MTRSLRAMPSLAVFAALATFVTLFAVESSADASSQCSSHKPSTAQLFTYEDMGTYKKVEATRCGKTYILYPRGQEAPDLGSDFQYFAVPLSKVVVTETVVVTFLESIGVRGQIAATSEWTSSACVANNIDEGETDIYIPHSRDATAHSLQVGSSLIDAIFASPWGTNSWEDQATAFKVICESSTSEVDPLGSAEWIKFFGYLFGKEEEAETAYCSVASRYECNARAAEDMTADSAVASTYGQGKKPTILFTSLSWDDQYSIAMPEYKQQFVAHAGAEFPDLAPFESFKTEAGTGYKFPPEQVNEFHAALSLADVLIDETYPHGRTLEIIKSDYGYTKPLVVGQTFLAGGADPAEGSNGWALTSHGVAEKLFTVDRDGRVVGQLARGVERAADGTWELTLEGGRKFSDGAPVTAEAVAMCIGHINELNAAASASAGQMTLTPLSELTLRIATERPTQVMASVLAEWPFVVYRDRGASRPVFTGAYEISAHTVGESMHLVPNIHHPGAARRAPFIIKRFSSGADVAQALESGDIDLAFNLPVEARASLSLVPGLTVKSFPVGYQYMMWINTRKAALSDVSVRKALSLAIDRGELARELQSGEAATGAFPETTPYGLGEALGTDAEEAARLLDAAGWVLGADGKRSKGGEALALDLVAYPMRPDLVAMQPVIKARLEALGVTVTERLTEDPNGVATSHDFDLFLWAQHTLPAGDPGFFLNAFFRTDAGNNHAGISEGDIDAALDALGSASSDAQRQAATEDAHRTIIDYYPVSFLLTPVWHVGMSRRLATYEPWGSDYHVIRPDITVFNDLVATDLPPAIRADRVYTMDGTMDARGPPWGGIDWFESRIAEPDSMLADLIAVLHRTSSAQPTDLHYLRHVSTGEVRAISAADCQDPSQPRPVRAATCQDLALDEPAALEQPAAVEPSSSSSASDSLALEIAVGVLGGLTLIFGAIAAFVYCRAKPAEPVTAKQVDKAASEVAFAPPPPVVAQPPSEQVPVQVQYPGYPFPQYTYPNQHNYPHQQMSSPPV